MNDLTHTMKCRESFFICIRALRVGEEGRFVATFNSVLDCIQEWLTQQASGPEPQLMLWLEEAMQCQMRHDNCRLADILEYEFMPLLFESENG